VLEAMTPGTDSQLSAQILQNKTHFGLNSHKGLTRQLSSSQKFTILALSFKLGNDDGSSRSRGRNPPATKQLFRLISLGGRRPTDDNGRCGPGDNGSSGNTVEHLAILEKHR